VSKESIVLLLGVLILFVPSLGIPADWKLYVLTGAGAILVIVGYLLRRAAYYRRIDRGNGERGGESFVESKGKITEPDSV